jgi:O-methyltransferase
VTPRRDPLDPLPYTEEQPSMRTAFGRVDIHSLAAFWAMETRLAGDYWEFGVGLGRSAVSAFRAQALYARDPVEFHLFDSFEGLPAPMGRDIDYGQFQEGAYRAGIEAVTALMTAHGAFDDRRVVFHAGFFELSLTPARAASLAARRIAILHIDVDLYESARLVLRFATPFMQPGMVVLFDDWHCFGASPHHGERAAAAEWQADTTTPFALEPYADYGWHGKAFIAVPKAPQT